MVDEDDVREMEKPEQDERLAEVRRDIAEAKADAADLRETNPDPFPDSDPPNEGGTPAN
ncbi:hypothetical protein [Saccharothrix xinjiangensis]|uniref:Uncharacterized protein n=1 Tax=Saccharothrix xinjiangensis TaxID=204798 RepID=A0ABV9Y979_9PSEU